MPKLLAWETPRSSEAMHGRGSIKVVQGSRFFENEERLSNRQVHLSPQKWHLNFQTIHEYNLNMQWRTALLSENLRALGCFTVSNSGFQSWLALKGAAKL
jgi:hypothetical protein